MNTSAIRINQRRTCHMFLVAWLVLALPTAVSAEIVAGRVVSTMGEVTAVRPDESARSLARGEPVYVEDTLRTGQRGRAQIRLIDDGLLDLRPLSRMTIDAYEESAPDEDEGGNAVMSFLRGAMRTVSGRIGRDPEDEYRMTTPTATVGIRGTDYSLQYCDADCADTGRPEGLYGRVDNGAVDVTNAAGTGVFNGGDYFYVEDNNTLPSQLIGPPPGILDGTDDGEQTGGEDEDPAVEDPEAALTRDDDDPELEVSVGADEFTSGGDNPEPATPFRVVRVATGGVFSPLTSLLEIGMARGGDGSAADFVANNDNEVVAISFADGRSVRVDEQAALSHTPGSDSFDGAEVFWGRWNDSDETGGIRFAAADGTESLILDFSYMYSEDTTTLEQLADLSGSLSFADAGGPNLLSTENSTNWEVAPGTSLDVDFSALTAEFALSLSCFDCDPVTGNLNVDVSNNDIDIDALGSLDVELTGGWTGNSGSGGAAGSMQGQFVGVTAEGVIISFSVDRLDNANVIEEIIGTRLLREGLVVP